MDNLYIVSGLLILLGYVCGSLPFGYWIVKIFKGVDITQIGSGGTGTTNVKRAAGWPLAILTLILDALKGAIPVSISQWVVLLQFSGEDPYRVIPVLVAIAAVVGHSKSFLLHFKGGKSVATGLGVFLVLQPVLIGLVLLVAIPVMFITRYVSLGSIIACVFASVLAFYFEIPLAQLIFTLLVAAYIIWLHKANIGRLLQGAENKF